MSSIIHDAVAGSHSDCKVVYALEGGYSLQALPACVTALLDHLMAMTAEAAAQDTQACWGSTHGQQLVEAAGEEGAKQLMQTRAVETQAAFWRCMDGID